MLLLSWEYEKSTGIFSGNYKQYLDAGKFLSELQLIGKIQNIGVTNFNTARMKEMVDSGVNIVSNQVDYFTYICVVKENKNLKKIVYCSY